MKKPSNSLIISDEEKSEIEFKFWQIIYKFMDDYGMSEKAAGGIAISIMELNLLTNLKNELEDMLHG